MTDLANPIVLDMAFTRLQFETGFDVRAVIAERDRYRVVIDGVLGDYDMAEAIVAARDALYPYCSDRCELALGHDGPCGTFGGSGAKDAA